MATRKKIKKKSTASKKSTGRKSPAKPPARKQKTAKKLAKRKALPKRAAQKKALAKTSAKKTQSGTSKSRNQILGARSSPFSPETSGLQSGDLQGLSNVESVDSESVDELLEEGNAFEAGVVAGVEDSRGREGKGVRTREVPEDDVPGEYLDEE
jgi:hypothetical protein